MEIKYVGRVLPSTGKQHQNQEVASGEVQCGHSNQQTTKEFRKCWCKMKVKILMTMPNMHEHNGRLYSVGGVCVLYPRENTKIPVRY